ASRKNVGSQVRRVHAEEELAYRHLPGHGGIYNVFFEPSRRGGRESEGNCSDTTRSRFPFALSLKRRSHLVPPKLPPQIFLIFFQFVESLDCGEQGQRGGQ